MAFVLLAAGVPIELPDPWDPTKLWVILALLGLLVLAFVMEGVRRGQQRRLRLRNEWRSVMEIAHSRDIAEEDQPLLRAFLDRQAPAHPFRAVTTYRDFEEAVERDMAWARDNLDAGALEEHGVRLRDIRQALRLDYIPFGQQMRSTRELPEGQAIWAATGEPMEASWQRLAIARVNEAWFALSGGAGQGTLDVKTGDGVRLRLWREDDARYLIEATVLRVEDAPARYVFTHTSNLRRVQARAHFRMRCSQAVEITVMSAPRDGNFENVEARPVITTLRGRITNVSGGGLAVMLDQPLPAQVMFGLPLRLNGPTRQVYCRIVHAAAISRGRYIVRGAFVNMSDETRDEISRFTVLQQQTTLGGGDEGEWV
jgi:c-di-GMP-binding flagellar brake protein YcgR